MTKTKISAQVIADSKNEFGERITSFVVRFPRIILAEFNTHRVFSRNSASSRAIPFEKMLKLVQEDPFIPIAWQKDHKGMQGTEYFETGEKIQARVWEGELFIKDVDETPEQTWLYTRDKAVREAKTLSAMGVTKQLCNRLLEPFMWHTVIVTATEWENFFSLRCPQYLYEGDEIKHKICRSRKDFQQTYLKDLHGEEVFDWDYLKFAHYNKGQAEIHAMALAEAMWDAQNASIPKELKIGEWHIPFGDNIDMKRLIPAITNGLLYDGHEESKLASYQMINSALIKISTARCARVSYLNFEGKDDYKADIKLHDSLLASGHMSPFEHCAKAMSGNEMLLHGEWSGNFKGFIQYRKTIPGENRG